MKLLATVGGVALLASSLLMATEKPTQTPLWLNELEQYFKKLDKQFQQVAGKKKYQHCVTVGEQSEQCLKDNKCSEKRRQWLMNQSFECLKLFINIVVRGKG